MKIRITRDFFVYTTGEKKRSIKTDLINDHSIELKQQASVKEYEKIHLKEEMDDEILYLMNEFQCFIAKNLISNNLNKGIVLDVGCGSYIKIPHISENYLNVKTILMLV